MKLQHLLLLGVILVGLLVLMSYDTDVNDLGESQKELTDLAVPIISDKLSLDAINALEITGENDSVIRLEKKDNWLIASAWNAIAKPEMINKFLEALTSVKGTVRSTKVDNQAEYGVDPAGAIAVSVFVDQRKEPIKLSIGKRLGYDQTFVLRQDNNNVLVVPYNLRSDLNVWDDAPESKPKTASFLKQEVQKVARDKITELELIAPDNTIKLTRKEEPAEPQPEVPEGEEPPPPPAPKYKWEVATSFGEGSDVVFKDSLIDSILGAVATVNVQDIVDPAKKAEYGLDNPVYKAIITLDDGQKHEIVGSFRADATQSAVMVTDSPDFVYLQDNYRFNQVFRKGSDLFTLPAHPKVDKDPLTNVALASADFKFNFARESATAEWTTVANNDSEKLDLKTDTMNTLLDTVSNWTVENIADSGRTELLSEQLKNPLMTLELAGKSATSHIFKLLGTHPALKSWYIATTTSKENDSVRIWVIDDAQKQKLFPEFNKILNLATALRLAPDFAFNTITVAGKDLYTFHNTTETTEDDKLAEPTWQVEDSEGKMSPAETLPVSRLISQLRGFDPVALVTNIQVGDAFTNNDNYIGQIHVTSTDPETKDYNLTLVTAPESMPDKKLAKIVGSSFIFALDYLPPADYFTKSAKDFIRIEPAPEEVKTDALAAVTPAISIVPTMPTADTPTITLPATATEAAK